jgi:hypothetical protein
MKTKATIIAAIALIAGCERVTEYKCSAEQVEKAKAQFEWCTTGTPDLTRRCRKEATAAHCEIVREFNRAEIK